MTPPSDAEVLLTVAPERWTSATEVRGRLMGPRCASASTVEIAYPLRAVPAPEPDVLAVRAVIPEASLWDPPRPFVYRAVVELWQDGQRCDRTEFDLGLRTVALGSRGLIWNGWPLTVRGTTQTPESPEEALRLRREGYNLVTAAAGNWPWPEALTQGFLVLGRLGGADRAEPWAPPAGVPACLLGWLLPRELLEEPGRAGELLAALRATESLLGVEERYPSTAELPSEIDFVVCPRERLSAGEVGKLPVLVRGTVPPGAAPYQAGHPFLGTLDG